MGRVVSIGVMLEQLDGLRDTSDLTTWEQEFVESVLQRYLLARKDSTVLTPKQVDVINKIWNKHFS